ncbi:hypothetical protein MJM99_33600, partial [Salmonella enterica subsp. enterica serovar Kentucky]|nr:hypothetical protein [Salmonella enterica subsp. enterica serovar Kentucky]
GFARIWQVMATGIERGMNTEGVLPGPLNVPRRAVALRRLLVSMTLKVRAVHGQLNEGAFDSQRYALAQHQPLTGRFLQAKAINP